MTRIPPTCIFGHHCPHFSRILSPRCKSYSAHPWDQSISHTSHGMVGRFPLPGQQNSHPDTLKVTRNLQRHFSRIRRCRSCIDQQPPSKPRTGGGSPRMNPHLEKSHLDTWKCIQSCIEKGRLDKWYRKTCQVRCMRSTTRGTLFWGVAPDISD